MVVMSLQFDGMDRM